MMGLETYYRVDGIGGDLTAIDTGAARRWALKQARAAGHQTSPRLATRGTALANYLPAFIARVGRPLRRPASARPA